MTQAFHSRLLPSQGRPPKAAETTSSRVRSCVPSPQVAVQPFQGVQSPHSQSTGQSMGAHMSSFVCCSFSGHGNPWPCACVTTPRDLCWLPPEHVAEHSDQSVQADTTQSTQALVQFTSSPVSPQAAPPAKGWAMMLRLLCCLPEQKGVQGVQPLQSVIWQSTGQAILSLQSSTWVSLPEHLRPPPSCCTATDLTRRRLPPSQDAVQSLQAVQECHSQSTQVLEQLETSATRLQGSPPFSGSLVMFRVLLDMPEQ
mmetsp:Transcript_24542/g.58211  ORF Transcript_24542/g.58211 Transcript_24542/m.58211 type:complete len:255 (-) Transcript_24542:450-1214(-)